MENRPILVVEDDPNDQDLILRALGRAGLPNPVVLAQDGQEALDRLIDPAKALSPLPALILLDIKLPKLNGFDVLQSLRQFPATRYIPVVMMSSSSEVEDMRMSYEQGANSYIRKPVAIKDFNAALSQVATYWLQLNQGIC